MTKYFSDLCHNIVYVLKALGSREAWLTLVAAVVIVTYVFGATILIAWLGTIHVLLVFPSVALVIGLTYVLVLTYEDGRF